MKWREVFLISCASIWFLFVVLWPSESDLPVAREDSLHSGSGEGLFKSSLTNANFGLLNVEFYESSENRKHWNIKSKFAELHRRENYAFLKDVTADFYAEKTGNVVFTKSDYGRSWIDKHLVELERDVWIKSKRGYLFTMDRLNYHSDTHFFDSKDVVQMKGPDVDHPAMHLRGVGLLADIDKEHFILKKNVVAQRRLKSSEWLRIQSRSGEFFTEDQKAIFTGRVRSVMPQMSIESEFFELSVSEEKEFIFAKGNVKLKNKNRVGHADSATIEVGSNRIVLEGKARVDSNSNEVRGRKIIIFSDDDRVEVEGAEGRLAP